MGKLIFWNRFELETDFICGACQAEAQPQGRSFPTFPYPNLGPFKRFPQVGGHHQLGKTASLGGTDHAEPSGCNSPWWVWYAMSQWSNCFLQNMALTHHGAHGEHPLLHSNSVLEITQGAFGSAMSQLRPPLANWRTSVRKKWSDNKQLWSSLCNSGAQMFKFSVVFGLCFSMDLKPLQDWFASVGGSAVLEKNTLCISLWMKPENVWKIIRDRPRPSWFSWACCKGLFFVSISKRP